MKLNIEKVIFESVKHRTMSSLAREFNIDVGMLRYNLGKARKLDLVKNIIRMNK